MGPIVVRNDRVLYGCTFKSLNNHSRMLAHLMAEKLRAHLIWDF